MNANSYRHSWSDEIGHLYRDFSGVWGLKFGSRGCSHRQPDKHDDERTRVDPRA